MTRTHKLLIWFGIVAVSAWQLWNSGQGTTLNAVTGITFRPDSVGNFVTLVAVIGLGYMLFRRSLWTIVISGTIGVLFMAYFGFNPLNILGVGIFLLANLYTYRRVDREMTERVRLDVMHMLYSSLFPIVLSFFLLISFAAFQSPLASELKSTHQLPSQTQEFFKQVVESTTGNKIQATNEQQRQLIINEIAHEAYIEANNFLKPYFQYAPPALAFGLFLILWGLSFIFVGLSALVGTIILWGLKRLKIVRVEERTIKAETLVI